MTGAAFGSVPGKRKKRLPIASVSATMPSACAHSMSNVCAFASPSVYACRLTPVAENAPILASSLMRCSKRASSTKAPALVCVQVVSLAMLSPFVLRTAQVRFGFELPTLPLQVMPGRVLQPILRGRLDLFSRIGHQTLECGIYLGES